MTVEVPIVNAPNLYVDDLGIIWGSNTTLEVEAGACRDSTNVNDIIISDDVVLNAATNGVNGLDNGALAASTMYAVYALGDSTQNNDAGVILSLSDSAPAIPVGYDMYRRIGWALTDGSAHFLLFYQEGSDKTRSYWYDVGISELSGGSATSFTDINLASSVPPINGHVNFIATFTPDGATEVAEFLPGGSMASNGIVRLGCGVAAAQVANVVVPCVVIDDVATVQYKVASGDTLTLLTAGYVDYL